MSAKSFFCFRDVVSLSRRYAREASEVRLVTPSFEVDRSVPRYNGEEDQLEPVPMNVYKYTTSWAVLAQRSYRSYWLSEYMLLFAGKMFQQWWPFIYTWSPSPEGLKPYWQGTPLSDERLQRRMSYYALLDNLS